jgi:hypothetical protein
MGRAGSECPYALNLVTLFAQLIRVIYNSWKHLYMFPQLLIGVF